VRRAEQLGPFRYVQSEDCFPLGQDTLLLAGFASLRPCWRVCDLGCGAGALPLLLLGREPSLRVTGIELEAADAELARRNLAENGLAGEIMTGDLRRAKEYVPAGSFDLAVSNPPYFPVAAGASGGRARAEECCTMAQLCATAGWMVKNGGRFALVHRPERLAELLAELRAHGLEPKRMQLVQHGPERPPSAVLLEAVRLGRPGLAVLPTKIMGGS
jgi:tRNA1Val (adenine37-N6)-methyltransferase